MTLYENKPISITTEIQPGRGSVVPQVIVTIKGETSAMKMGMFVHRLFELSKSNPHFSSEGNAAVIKIPVGPDEDAHQIRDAVATMASEVFHS